MAEKEKKLRGFAIVKRDNPDRMAELARKGGESVPSDKRSFSQDRELAKAAGSKGGTASHGGKR